MSDLQELYQEVILDHCRNPRNRGLAEPTTHRAEGYNPLCGDRVIVTMALDGERIESVAFEGEGCAISLASASIMTQALRGKSREEARALVEVFRGALVGPAGARLEGELAALAGVRNFPMRVKCATLAWHTMVAALAGPNGVVTTE